ncbi:MAG: glycerol acyltransferase [Bacteroidales bacterium]
MESGKQKLTISIKQVIASKSSNLAKYTPNFIINAIKRIIHEDEINFILKKNCDKTGVDFANGCLKILNVSCNIKYINRESISKTGRYIFASNHPLGGLDGLILISELGNEFGDIKFIVNDLLMNIKPLEPIFVPVNKVGKMSKEYGELINKAYASQSDILYFPAGLCSRLINGQITDPKWQKNFLRQALKYNRDIVPMYFEGKNSMFFYRLAKFRKFIGTKFNIEMIFLPNEMFKQKNSIFDVVIGKPITAESLKNSIAQGKSIDELCLEIRLKSYELKMFI